MGKKRSILSLFKSKAERKAYAIGRKHQYDKEHPLIKYESVPIYTRYKANGTVDSTYSGRPYGYKNKRDAYFREK